MNIALPLRLVGALVALSLVASCSYGAESTPQTIPERERGAPTGTLRSPLGRDGEARIYLPRRDINSGPFLDSVARVIDETEIEAILLTLINDLISGPSAEERASGFDTALPTGTQVLSVARGVRRVTLDLAGPLTFLDEAELVVALAQIVYTVSEITFIRKVIIKVDGEIVEWPRRMEPEPANR